MPLVMIDMGVGNLRSIQQALGRVGARVQIATEGGDLAAAAGVIVPGVGVFSDGMRALAERGFLKQLQRLVRDQRRPVLGICLGMQLLALAGEEGGPRSGLGLIQGRVKRLERKDSRLRVPNIGWCDVTPHKPSVLFGNALRTESFYFAHSYHLVCDDPQQVAATLEYNGAITAAVEFENVFGVQFHPEKSQDAGLDLLERFVQFVGSGCEAVA